MPPRKRVRDASSSAEKKVEDDLNLLSPEDLRKELMDIGENPGPIDASNKSIYIRMLVRKKLKLETETTPDSSSFIESSSPPSSLPSTSLTRSPISLTRVTGGAQLASKTGGRTPRASQTTTKTPTARKTAAKGRATKPAMAKDFSKFEVKGLVAATYTPFNDNGDINLSVLSSYADHLLTSGVNNVFVNGSTGESLCLTVEERKLLAEAWTKVSAGRITVIVHVGTESLKDTCALASHAQSIGAAAIGVQPTTFFKPASIEHLISYLEKVSEAAPDLPMFYYHIPIMTGVKFSMETFLESAASRLPNLRGLKYTDSDLMEFGRCVTFRGGKYQILYGSDQQVLGALCLGGIAAIGSTYNYAGKLYNRLFSAYKSNNMEGARLEQRRSQAMIRLLFKYGGDAGVGKEFLRLQGVDCGPPRLPVLPMTSEAIKNLETDLKEIGFFEWL